MTFLSDNYWLLKIQKGVINFDETSVLPSYSFQE